MSKQTKTNKNNNQTTEEAVEATAKPKKNKSKFVTEKEQKILSNIIDTTQELQEALVEQGFLSQDLFDELEKIEHRIDEFAYNEDDIRSNIRLLGEYTGYSVYLKKALISRNVLKAYLKNINANNWLVTKGEALQTSQGELLKTDTYVNKEVETKMNNFNIIEGYISDLELRINRLEQAVSQIIILINVKIKTEREEWLTIAGYKDESFL